ncbi:MAG: NAD-dependent epimerase/dehydratase family protein [Cyclobacteriaceae bacterium]|nr:NAD-dependent epimerase/dehydratase family protein [Cyclobacteriaceae bacterium]
MEKILITGSSGQLGSELIIALSEAYGEENIVAADIHEPKNKDDYLFFEKIDVIDKNLLLEVARKYKITQIYHLAAILSATGEKHPGLAWRVNIDGLMNVLDVARDLKVKKVYWPSSIAVFGPNTPKQDTPQHTVTDPGTVYGISKLTGERLVEYYFYHYGLDVRSLRYPGLIGYQSLPGGGTTDYAVEIFHKAIMGDKFTCFLRQDSRLPMMYMPDAVRATLELMEADAGKIKIRSSYNIGAMSFTPGDIYRMVKKHYPRLEIEYRPDFRQEIADSWPRNIEDSYARHDWGWNHHYDLERMTEDMIMNLKERIPATG